MSKVAILVGAVVVVGLMFSAPAAQARGTYHGPGAYFAGKEIGSFSARGKERTHVVKVKQPKHHRVCIHHHSGHAVVEHDGQTSEVLPGNCLDMEAASIAIYPKQEEQVVHGVYHPVQHHR